MQFSGALRHKFGLLLVKPLSWYFAFEEEIAPMPAQKVGHAFANSVQMAYPNPDGPEPFNDGGLSGIDFGRTPQAKSLITSSSRMSPRAIARKTAHMRLDVL